MLWQLFTIGFFYGVKLAYNACRLDGYLKLMALVDALIGSNPRWRRGCKLDKLPARTVLSMHKSSCVL